MSISWSKIRIRAASFAEEWKDARYEKGETQTFYNDFFGIFGINRRRVAYYEQPVKKLGNKRGFIDLFWKGMLLVEQKSIGKDLRKAKEQAFDYFPGIKEEDLPRYILLSDFQSFELYDLDEGEEFKFRLCDLPDYIECFGFILGIQKRSFKDQDPVNIKASELMGNLYDSLKISGYETHDLEKLLVRLLFCLFADDTGIFEPRDAFWDFLINRTSEDGSDTGLWILQIFEILDTPIDSRQQKIDEDLSSFPYVNGNLFSERIAIPIFDFQMRKQLLDACEFNWDAVSPAIFGSLFQSVMDSTERRNSGAHYTTEKNILKLIEPLFLDELRGEFKRLKQRRDSRRRKALEDFQDKLGRLTFFDPACGCGNFLIIAYRELRLLEIDVLREIYPKDDRQRVLITISQLSKIDVNQFYGIEISEFPVRIAEVAMWMMDHIMNNFLSLEFGEHYTRIPLRSSPQIIHADALDTDWNSILAAKNCSYVLGNPPFIGAKPQSPKQRRQVRSIANLGGSGGTLDYVSAWFIKAGEYTKNSQACIAFVATNSITQGEQVAQLWPILFGKLELEVFFAHRTFVWGSEARGKAHVHVVIIGLINKTRKPLKARLFSYKDINGEPDLSEHAFITAYLFDGSQLSNPHIVIKESKRNLCDMPRLITGTKPIDGGFYIFTQDEKDSFTKNEPKSKDYFFPYVGSKESINGQHRYLLLASKIPPNILRSMPSVTERIEKVRKFRLGRDNLQTQKMAEVPTRFHITVIPEEPFLCIPESSSSQRKYIPIAFLKPPIVPSNLVRILPGASPWQFGILTSRMHIAWLSYIGGRIKSDYRYSIGIVYNNFPWPLASDAQRNRVEMLANNVLEARNQFSDSCLADLYDPNVMPEVLKTAHLKLDAAVDKLYQSMPFENDRSRVEYLFLIYEKMIEPLSL